MTESLRSSLERHEGRRRRAYRDTKNIWTVGIGRNIEQVDFSDDEIDLMFKNDLERATLGAYGSVAKFQEHPTRVRDVLIELCFQLGTKGLRGFKNMLAAIDDWEYELAAEALLDSKLAREDAPARAKELADKLRGSVDPRTRA